MNHTPFNELQLEAQAVQDYLEMPVSDDLTSIKARGLELQVYAARTGAMLADASYWLNEAKAEQVNIVLEALRAEVKLAAATQKAIIECKCREQTHLVDFIERLNSSAGKQGMMLMTIMSTLKEEMKLTGNQT